MVYFPVNGYVCIFTYPYTNICACVYACTNIKVYILIHKSVCVCVYIYCIQIEMWMYIQKYSDILIYIHSCQAFVYIHIHMTKVICVYDKKNEEYSCGYMFL